MLNLHLQNQQPTLAVLLTPYRISLFPNSLVTALLSSSRHLAILYTLVKSQNDFISSEELAEKTMSSVRTAKSDIAMLNNVLKAEHIGSIESRRTGEHGSVRVLSAYTERNTLHSRLHCRRK